MQQDWCGSEWQAHQTWSTAAAASSHDSPGRWVWCPDEPASRTNANNNNPRPVKKWPREGRYNRRTPAAKAKRELRGALKRRLQSAGSQAEAELEAEEEQGGEHAPAEPAAEAAANTDSSDSSTESEDSEPEPELPGQGEVKASVGPVTRHGAGSAPDADSSAATILTDAGSSAAGSAAQVEVAAGSPAKVEVAAGSPAKVEVAAGSPAKVEVAAGSPAKVEVSAAGPDQPEQAKFEGGEGASVKNEDEFSPTSEILSPTSPAHPPQEEGC